MTIVGSYQSVFINVFGRAFYIRFVRAFTYTNMTIVGSYQSVFMQRIGS